MDADGFGAAREVEDASGGTTARHEAWMRSECGVDGIGAFALTIVASSEYMLRIVEAWGSRGVQE